MTVAAGWRGRSPRCRSRRCCCLAPRPRVEPRRKRRRPVRRCASTGANYTVCVVRCAPRRHPRVLEGRRRPPLWRLRASGRGARGARAPASLRDERRHVRGRSLAGRPVHRRRQAEAQGRYARRRQQLPPEAERRVLDRRRRRRHRRDDALSQPSRLRALCDPVGPDAGDRRPHPPEDPADRDLAKSATASACATARRSSSRSPTRR